VDLIETLRTTGSIRDFTAEPVSDEVLYEILDDARFAPSGGNRQAWHAVVVQDPSIRREVGAVYLEHWRDYVAHLLAGLIPFSPSATEEDRAAAAAQRGAAEARSKPDGFAENFATVPALIAVCANLDILVATDRDLGRYTFAGGASIYPFVWSILLSARERGLGGVITTIAIRGESELREVLGLPPGWAVASLVVLGHPTKRHTKLTRRSVEEFATVDRFSGNPLRPANT
jgi:nitroreductase